MSGGPTGEKPAGEELASERPIDPAGLSDWLLRHGRSYPDAAAFATDLGKAMIAMGFPIWRFTLFVPETHPYIQGRTYEWYAETGDARQIEIERGVRMTRFYHHSPIALAMRMGAPVRRLLENPDEIDFETLEELAARGATDYIVYPMPLEDERSWAIASFATDRPGGFTSVVLAALEAITPALGAVAEIYGKRRDVIDLLRAYVGRAPAEQIRRGGVSLGGGHTIRAIIWFCDMRDFTGLSERLDRDAMLELLADYFAAMVGAVEAAGGDVLKFMGDGLLAAFGYTAATGADAAARALDAALQAQASLAAANAKRAEAGKAVIACGIALHAGQVTAGNIGSRDRLDFTLVGPAVNLASRLEGLTKRLAEPVIISAEFAELYGNTLRPLGMHRLRGIAELQEVWAPP